MTYTATLAHHHRDGKKDEFHVGGHAGDEAGKRCSLSFNPGGHEPTERIKLACTVAMKAIINEREAFAGHSPGMARCFATAPDAP